MFFKKQKPTNTMADVQNEFTEKAEQVLNKQNVLAATASEQAIELAKQADEQKQKAEQHKDEANKAQKFIENISKMFE